ncbi:MAG: DNA polymerase IV [Actinobacteria bacterium]|nr:DNA polymerase IV [Actinomycetota bacterium]
MTHSPNSWRGRAILHVDMDAFFAAVEQLDHPEWRGKPVIVGSPDGRGVVSTASYEARAFGIHSAMPSAQATRRCPDAVWARPRFARYAEISQAVCEMLETFTPFVQRVSIDEAYLDVTPTHTDPTDPVAIAHGIRAAVDDLGITCSIGVATSKTVAKIASDHDKPHGITVVRPGDESAFLAPLPAIAIPGVGGATAERLRDVGIRTIGDLAALDEASALQLLGSHGPELVMRASGIDPRPALEEHGVKSVSAEHTFARDVRERTEVAGELKLLVERVARRLRSKGLKGRTVSLKLRYADFTTKTPSRTMAVASDIDASLLPVALELLSEAWTPGAGLRLLGFGVSGFAERAEQLDLLSGSQPDADDRVRSLARSIDAVKARFGDSAIGYGHAVSDEPDE